MTNPETTTTDCRLNASTVDGIWRWPDVMGGTPCIAETRIPTKAIWAFFRDGYTTSEIIDQYPTLTAQKVEVAIRFERARRMKRWRALQDG